MVSMTWKKVIGSVSIPFDERGSSKRNSPASCSLSSRAGGSRRVLSISLEAAATAPRTASAREITRGSPARSDEVVISVSKIGCSRLCPAYRRPGRGLQRNARGQFTVDLLDRLAAGLDAEEVIDRARHQEPAAEIDERQRNFRQRHVGLEVIAGAYDQRQPDRSDDLADAAKAIGRAHARGAQMRRPDLRRIGPDDRKTAIG